MRYSIEVKPNSKNDAIEQIGRTLVVHVHAPAREGKANSALLKILAEYFHVAPSRVTIVRGARGRKKVIEIDGTI